MIVLKKYYIRINRLFVFQCFSDVFKEGSYKVKRDSLGLAEKGKVNKKEKVTNKKAYKL
jgi:hypothetical protein